MAEHYVKTSIRVHIARQLEAKQAFVIWLLFFFIAFGLGYPTLNRYDPRELGADWQSYYRVVTDQATQYDRPFCYRVLVLDLAKPFYWLARGRVHSWNPVFFGLLISNCLFCATATLLLLLIGLRITRNRTLALLACALYLLNYAVPNLWLSGMVDSSEACLLLALTWALFSEKWWLLPLIGIVGGMAKQSFLPFSVIFAGTWWLAMPGWKRNYRQTIWVAGLGLASAASVVFVYWTSAGHFLSPVAMTRWWTPSSNLAFSAFREVSDHQFWYAFIWLLPLGVWRLKRMPRPWMMASLATAVFTFGLGAYVQLRGTVNRPLFSVIGPILSLSAASLIAGVPIPAEQDFDLVAEDEETGLVLKV